MCNVLLCTHSTLAQGFRDAAMMIARSAPSLEILCFEDGCSLDTLLCKMQMKTERFRQAGETYCVVTDMFGASPFNAAMQVCAEDQAFVITGVNLGLLLELLSLPQAEATLDKFNQFVHEAQEQIYCFDPAAMLKAL